MNKKFLFAEPHLFIVRIGGRITTQFVLERPIGERLVNMPRMPCHRGA